MNTRYLGTLYLLALAIAPEHRLHAYSQNLPNLISVDVSCTTSFNSDTKIYTYQYMVSSASTSQQNVWFFALSFGGPVLPEILNPLSPVGWTFGRHSDSPTISWAATAIPDTTPPAIDDGSIPASPFQIAPGQQLSGFSFQSHTPPGVARFYAQGFVQPTSAASTDLDDEQADESVSDDFLATGGNGSTQGPVSPSNGSGVLSVQGFLVIISPSQDNVFANSVTFQLRFSLNGETVDRTSLHASLNGTDVTSLFAAASPPADLQTTLKLGASSALTIGRNELLTSVSGIDPSTGGTTADIDRVSFTVVSGLLGDVNGDSAVNCGDIAIVRAAFGRKVGELAYDQRADTNLDGVIDLRDLAFVSQHLPAGTRCQ